MPSRILVVDDESSVRSLLNRLLTKEGFEVFGAANGQEGLELSLKNKPNLVILDLNLPDIPGEEICQKIRQTLTIEALPILILTGRTTEGLVVRCLNAGADDYVAKPFDIEELIAHVRALLRRPPLMVRDDAVIKQGRIAIHGSERLILWEGRRMQNLTPKEFELLRQLVLLSPRVVSKNDLAVKVWGTPMEQIHQRTVDVHVRRIRQKMGPKAASCLRTIPIIGYQWLDQS